jgi:DNA-binding transcriptional regulator YiaG
MRACHAGIEEPEEGEELGTMKTQALADEIKAAKSCPSPHLAKMIRQAAGVTQRRFAAELGVDRVTLARWEAGTMRPRMEMRARWAQTLEDLQRAAAA